MNAFQKIKFCSFLISCLVFSLSPRIGYADSSTVDSGGKYEEQQKGVVWIEVWDEKTKENYQGTGFIVDSSGVILTADHLLEKTTSKIRIKRENGDTYENEDVDVVDVDHKRDIAIIKIKAVNLPYITLGNSDEVKKGDQIFVIGNPEGLEFSISDGLVSALRDSESGYKWFQVTAPISPGSSGGPVFNLKGEAIGIVTNTMKEGQNLNFAVPVNYIKPRLKTFPKWTYSEYAEKRLKEQRKENGDKIELGKSYMNSNGDNYNPELAIQIFKGMVDEYGPWGDGYCWLGKAYVSQANVGLIKAEECQKKAIELNPDDYAPYLQIAYVYEAWADYKNAVVFTEKSIQLAQKVLDATEKKEDRDILINYISEVQKILKNYRIMYEAQQQITPDKHRTKEGPGDGF